MICTCGHHAGSHRPFCRECDFNTAGCRKFDFDMPATLHRLNKFRGYGRPKTAVTYNDIVRSTEPIKWRLP